MSRLPSSRGSSSGIPAQLGKYTPLARLASGGMGEVYVAQMSAAAGFEKTVVIKTLLPELARDEQFVKLFLDEARLTARLTHPNICQVFELTEVAGEYYLVMEYLEGLSLSHLYGAYQDRGMDPRVAAGMCVQACEGLEYAHSFRDPDRGVDGVVHRDVSPHNLMLTVSGLVKLLDFGVAKLQREGSQTVTGSAKGKYAYMSPEQLHCEPLDRRSDIFSLGVVLFELLTGTRLFRRKSELASMQAIVDGDRPQLVDVNPGLPPALSRVVDRALGVERHTRYPTARAFADALSDAMSPYGGPASLSELAGFILENHGRELDAQRVRIKQATDRVAKLDPSELEETTIRSARHRLPLRAPTETEVARARSLALLEQALATQDDDDELSARRLSRKLDRDAASVPPVPPAALADIGAEPGTATSASGLMDARPSPPRRSHTLLWMSAALVVLAIVGWFWQRGIADKQAAKPPDGPVASAAAAPSTTPSPAPRPLADAPADPARSDAPAESTEEPAPTPSDSTTEPTTRREPDKEPVKRKRKRRERKSTTVSEDGEGYLTIDAVPYADIYVDGRKLGVTPLVRVELPAGEHKVKAVSSAGEKRMTLRIEKDKTTKRRITF